MLKTIAVLGTGLVAAQYMDAKAEAITEEWINEMEAEFDKAEAKEIKKAYIYEEEKAEEAFIMDKLKKILEKKLIDEPAEKEEQKVLKEVEKDVGKWTAEMPSNVLDID